MRKKKYFIMLDKSVLDEFLKIFLFPSVKDLLDISINDKPMKGEYIPQEDLMNFIIRFKRHKASRNGNVIYKFSLIKGTYFMEYVNGKRFKKIFLMIELGNEETFTSLAMKVIDIGKL